MRLPRWIHRAYAWLKGYFWLPCPICKTMFGGHEAGDGSCLGTDGRTRCICRRCTEYLAKTYGVRSAP